MAGIQKVFYGLDRDRAKIGMSPDQLAYVEALEQIARDGLALWAGLEQSVQSDRANTLYDALSVVNFMDEGQV